MLWLDFDEISMILLLIIMNKLRSADSNWDDIQMRLQLRIRFVESSDKALSYLCQWNDANKKKTRIPQKLIYVNGMMRAK